MDFERNETKGLDTDLPGVAAYTKEMNKIKRALKKRQDYDPNAYYLFLIKKSEDGKKNGIMPFNRHFGFIFLENDKNLASNPEKLQHTIAHELGHGAFTLYHTFSSKDKSIPQGSTYNLMDYTFKMPNNLLRKYQWHTIHNPRISLFGGEEEEVSEEKINEITKYLKELKQEIALIVQDTYLKPEKGNNVQIENDTKMFYGFINYVINWQDGKEDPEINITQFNPKNPREYGGGFEGVSYTVNYWEKNGDFIKNKYLYKKRGHKFIGVLKTEYGLYYGSTALFKVNRQGEFTQKYDYLPTAIDAVDQGAKMHDIGYDKVNAVGITGLLDSWATTPADIKAIQTWEKVIEIGVGGIDPYNQTSITQKEIKAAKSGVKLFKQTSFIKKFYIAHWMQINYPDIAQTIDKEDIKEYQNSSVFNYAVTYNYQKFLEYYMYEEYDKKYDMYFFKKREGKWNKDGVNYIPIPSEKIKF